MIVHRSTIHGRCPLNHAWDYYEVEIRTDDFVDVKELEAAMDSVRGSTQTQEDIANELRDKIPASCVLVVRGRHSQNTSTLVEL